MKRLRASSPVVLSVATVATALLAACTAGPDYREPAVLSGQDGGRAIALVEAASPVFAAQPLPDGWWRLYGDATLDDLIDRALVRNPDLRSAFANLEQAQAQLRVAERLRTPSTTLTANPSYGQASADALGAPKALSPGPVYDAGAMFSYDFDVAGRLRRQIEVARDQVGAQEAALDLARVTIAASTAGAYATVCATGLEIAVTEQSIRVAEDGLAVTQRRFDAGVNGINDVVRARTLLRQTVADLPALQAQNRAALYMLATLVGDAPELVPAAVAGCIAPPVLRQALPVGAGADLLRRRPDVRQAERGLAAAVAEIGVSTADLYPTIMLGASIGTTATSFNDIARDRAFRWSVGPLLTWTFPNVSVTRARIEVSNAAARAALARFDGVVLNALRETETSMVTLARRLDTERDLGLARDDAALASRNVETLYRGGIGQFLDTLDAQRTLIQAQIAVAQATAQVSQDQITLFQSLGGGWQGAPFVERVPVARVAAPRL